MADLDRVARFIEVKGRSSKTGSIPLEDNQLESARTHGERYFIYRIYEAVEGKEWQVVVLADPLRHDWPLSYNVDLFRCSESEYWTVTSKQK